MSWSDSGGSRSSGVLEVVLVGVLGMGVVNKNA